MRRAWLLAALTLLMLLGSGAPAYAISAPGVPGVDLDCKEAPVPEVPGRGATGFLADAPNPLPAEADPFAEQSTTSIYEQYGFAGLRWETYDLGCGPDAARYSEGVLGTAMANWTVEIPKFVVGLAAVITEVAFEPTFLQAFDPLIANTVGALRAAIFDPYAALFIAALGVVLLWRARTLRMSKVAGALAWAMLVGVIAAVLFQYPVAAGGAADTTITRVLGSVNATMSGQTDDGGDPASQVAGNLHEAVLWQTWVAGEFGKANGAAARKWGPRLFESRALTWREAAVLEQDPAAGRKIIEGKQERFEKVADEVAEQDPDAYGYLTGKRGDGRISAALLAVLAALCAAPFLLISGMLIIGTFLIIRLAVMFFPVIATFGVLPATAGAVKGVGNVVGAALINCLVFGVGAAFTVLAIGTLLSPDSGLPGWLALVLMGLLTVVMFAVLKPFRSLSKMANPSRVFADAASAPGDLAGRAWGGTKRFGGAAASAAAGSYIGAAAALEHSDAEDRAEKAEATERESPRPRFEGQPSAASEPGPSQALAAAVAPPATAPAALPVAVPIATPAVEGAAPALGAAEPVESAVGQAALPATDVPATEPPSTSMPGPVEPGLPGGVYVPGTQDLPPVPEQMPPAVEPEVVGGEEVYVLYRPESEEVSPDA